MNTLGPDEDTFTAKMTEDSTTIDFGWEPTRRLPVYLLLDCSASMAGAPIQAVNEGVRQLHNELIETPTAVETVWVSVITFGTQAQLAVPLTPVTQLPAIVLHAGGLTSLGAGLRLLEHSVDADVRTGSETEKGDWRPLVFLLTDGDPTDDWEPIVARLKSRTEKKLGSVVALACGDSVELTILQQIADHVFRMEDVTIDRLRDFFRWVSQSVSGASISAEAASRLTQKLSPLPDGLTAI